MPKDTALATGVVGLVAENSALVTGDDSSMVNDYTSRPIRHSCVLRLHSDDRYRQFDSRRHLTCGSMEETAHWQLVFEDSASATKAKGPETEDVILSTGVCGLVTRDITSTVIVDNFWSLEPPF